jgi:hypothetical protein
VLPVRLPIPIFSSIFALISEAMIDLPATSMLETATYAQLVILAAPQERVEPGPLRTGDPGAQR